MVDLCCLVFPTFCLPKREYPVFVEILSPLCGSGSKSELHVTWRPSPYMEEVNHTLTLTGKATTEVLTFNLQDEQHRKETYSHSFYGLKSREKYDIKVFVTHTFCSNVISSNTSALTGYVTPRPVGYATLQQINKNTCRVTWTWPHDKEYTIQNFVVSVVKYPNISTVGHYQSVFNLLKQENFQLNVPSQNRLSSFLALPNRRHVINVFGQSCSGNGIAAKAVGECIAPISSPSSIPSISLGKSSSNSYIVSMRFADELNGPISCYFVVMQFADSSLSNNKPANLSQSFLNDLESTNSSEANSGLPYLAFGVKQSEKQGIDFTLGDNNVTSCDITGGSGNTSFARQKRSLPTGRAYAARNFPVVQNKSYSMYVISSTPTLDGNILFASSNATYFVSQPNVEETESKIWIAGLVSAGVVLFLLAAFLRRRISASNSSALFYNSSCDQPDKSKKPLEIPFKNIKLLNKVGEGHFSEVWKARISYKNFNSMEAAAKIIKGAHFTFQQREEFEMELELMHQLGQNPFVIQLYGISRDKGRIIALIELVTNGDLHQFLVKNRPVPPKAHKPIYSIGTIRMTEFSRDIASGMEFISSMNLVHRDLACRNVLLTETLRCKISDFGLSRQVNKTEGIYVKLNLKNANLPSRWMSPEAYFDQTYTSASDVWSFGVVMWEIVAFGYTPYKKLSGRELQNKVLQENYRLAQLHYCPFQLYNIMQCCWNISPSQRPTFAELRKELKSLVDVIEDYQPEHEDIVKKANLH